MEFPEQIEQAVLKAYGAPAAAKRGRNPAFPYVPIVNYGPQQQGVHRTRTRQVANRAFATREEAIECARQAIARGVENFRKNLADPRERALREMHGLPRELPTEEAR